MDTLLSTRGGTTTITFIEDDGRVFDTITNEHVNFKAIFELVSTGKEVSDDELRALVQPAENITETLAGVSDKFTYENNQIYYDGSPVLDLFATQLVRILKEAAEDTDNEDKQLELRAVAVLGEKLMEHDSFHVRNHVLDFVKNRDLTITKDGNLLAYKGVVKQPLLDADGNETDVMEFHSVASGPADVVRVNGEYVPKGRVPNPVGAVVEMDRRNVDDNSNNHCSNGLHAGSWSYASKFPSGDSVGFLMVEIDPRDIVTVPPDHDCQKLRVCKYRILEATETEYAGAVYRG